MTDTATLLLSSANQPEKEPLTSLRLSRLHIFLLFQASHLVNHPFSEFSPGQRIYCAYGLNRLTPPPKITSTIFSAGGLANLAEMLRESERIVCNQIVSKPLQRGIKRLGITLPGKEEKRLEAVRLACGLAGCGHGMTLVGVAGFAPLFEQLPAGRDYLEALPAMGGTCCLNDPGTLDMILTI